MEHHQIIVIGGGTGGIMVASQLLSKNRNLDIAVLEPSDTHWYQPAWTLVGANAYDYNKTKRSMASVMPKGVKWIKEYAAGFNPEQNAIQLANGESMSYDFLVVAPGIKIDTSLVKGLPEAIDKGVVCSNYTNPNHTWNVLKNFKGGTALFTQPTTPIKCGGAPQKIMYLADDYFRKAKVRNNSKVVFATSGTVIFGVKPIAKTLMEVIDRKDINLRLGHKLVEIDSKNNTAWYDKAPHYGEHNPRDIEIIEDGDRIGIKYDMIHLAPPQTAPDFVRNSVLANEAGWLDVHKTTMQHNKYGNIFGVGDTVGLPTAKTGAAVRKQVPVIVDNLLRMVKEQGLGSKAYNGYSSCPLVTGYGKMVLAEFDYDNNFTPDPKLKQMLITDSSKEHWRLWVLKKHILPYLYWNKMMRGQNV